MKRLILVLLLVAMPSVALGGALFPGYIESGGYGKAMAQVSQLGNGERGFFLGGGGGLLLNRKIMIGADVSFLANDIPYTPQGGERRFIEYALVSLNLGYTFWPETLIHPAISVNGGMGWLRLRNPEKEVDERDPDADTTFHGQPRLHLILNLTRTTRVDLSGGYRWVTGINTEGFIDQDAEGAFVDLAFMFGAF